MWCFFCGKTCPFIIIYISVKTLEKEEKNMSCGSCCNNNQGSQMPCCKQQYVVYKCCSQQMPKCCCSQNQNQGCMCCKQQTCQSQYGGGCGCNSCIGNY